MTWKRTGTLPLAGGNQIRDAILSYLVPSVLPEKKCLILMVLSGVCSMIAARQLVSKDGIIGGFKMKQKTARRVLKKTAWKEARGDFDNNRKGKRIWLARHTLVWAAKRAARKPLWKRFSL